MEDGNAGNDAVSELITAIVEICSDVLQKSEIGANDNFTDLRIGAQRALRIVTLTNQWLGAQLTLRQFFLSRTPARLARALHEQGVHPPVGGTFTQRKSGDEDRRASGYWETFWDSTYRFSGFQQVGGFNTAGWYDKRALRAMPESHMREWVQSTVARLLSLNPRRIFEIGCGVGLIMSQMLEHCERYVGSDLSGEAVRRLRESLASNPQSDRIDVFRADARGAVNRMDRGYDLVLLNSVIQYFPDMEYLSEVLAGLMKGVESSGSIFIGDILNRDLHHAMHVTHVAEQFPGTAPVSQILKAVGQSLAGDTPLLVSPGELLRTVGQISPDWDCHALVRRGCEPTEMNRFRYDAVLSQARLCRAALGDPPSTVTWPRSHPFDSAEDVLSSMLHAHGGRMIIRSVPDARSYAAVELSRSLEAVPADATLAHARSGIASVMGMDPEMAWEVGHRLGYGVAVAPDRQPGYVNAAFWRGSGDWDAASLL
ncbi:class I SAM-dependent methyltransferase [Streptomyces johnsoniae]|uniref:Methyltransferase domain-containing protein n=1 Tax=Streptomyces johnsoniae TaxID=3075532 RepID=A0ABU2S9R8_9ACTN|nr:methyltransferase [Streptomyces sp. DSM 41886]MDT0445426.1 methyltransferase domain-containing protein [Streptomyces sp. DSM 41886]